MTADAIMRETRIAASQQRVWDVVTRAEHIDAGPVTRRGDRPASGRPRCG
jgi:uncharacterized protein YndB with AHSA1/START domain